MQPPDTIPTSPDAWQVPQAFGAHFDWRFGADDSRMLRLYERGKAKQWIAAERIDWAQELDFDNPMQLPPSALPLAGSALVARMSQREQTALVRAHQSWTISQFLHGEQGALICAGRVVQQVPDLNAKLFAATQVIDEARHVELYQRLALKFGAVLPMADGLQTLLGQVIQDQRWDMIYLGMQIVIEGLALASFARIRDQAQNPLAASVHAYVMEDEARHVAFGSISLSDYYPHLTQAERDEREEFLIEACHLMRRRLDAVDLWRMLDLDLAACEAHLASSPERARFEMELFARLVPAIKAIGLWGPKIRRAFAAMGVLHFGATDLAQMHAEDERIAQGFDRRHG